MPRICKECGLQFDTRGLHDSHWKKCVKTVTFIAPNGEDVTVTCDKNGTFACYCSHDKCPKEQGFATVGALQRHMKTLQTSWLGPEKKASDLTWLRLKQPIHQPTYLSNPSGAGGSQLSIAKHYQCLSVTLLSRGPTVQHCKSTPTFPSNPSVQGASTSAMQVTTNASQLAPGIEDETMKSSSLMSTEDTAMKSPLVGADEPSGQGNELTMASPSPSAFSPRSPMPMQGSSLMSLVDPTPSAPQPATAQTMMEGVRTEHHFIHHPYLDSLNLAVNAEFHFLVAATLPTITGPRTKVHGLQVFDAMACKFCPAVFTKEKKLREHHGLQHHDIPVPQHWQSCQAQHMKAEGAGSVRKLWQVTGDTRVGGDSRKKVLVDDLLKELDQELKTVQVPTDHCLVSPWLLTTHWHEWARWFRKPTEELHALVSPPCLSVPDEEQYKTLAKSIQLYFEEAVSLIDTTDELVLQ
ncbi:hypothetical protein EDC04DRAFT_2600389 [Pisolithus marmoratus]|nr:hypothetical protein EDC04DRAFT_2600389 [Pisolithus marmoratus]